MIYSNPKFTQQKKTRLDTENKQHDDVILVAL